jgi:hypothetical protein
VTLNDVLTLLREVGNATSYRRQLVFRFQQIVWHDLPTDAGEEVAEILRDLALDLAYYEPNPLFRAESPEFVDDRRAEEEIAAAIAAIESLDRHSESALQRWTAR